MGLIEEQVKEAERKRAELEGREPDYENPAGIAGVVLNPGDSYVAVYSGYDQQLLDPETLEPAPGFENFTVNQLKDVLRNENLAVSGTKDELLERLKAADIDSSDYEVTEVTE